MGGMSRLKLIGIVAALILAALGLGFAWGASGRVALVQGVEDMKQQLDVAEARGHILDARVSLYNVNFGNAQRELDDAKTPLARARDRAQAEGKKDAADALSAALDRVQNAQRLASRLDQAANSQADEALKSIQKATSR
jgi:hypothetical protein